MGRPILGPRYGFCRASANFGGIDNNDDFA
jgi:hypothetical protein